MRITFKTLLFLPLVLFLYSCGSSRSKIQEHARKVEEPKEISTITIEHEPVDHRAEFIVENAKEFLGTKYKYGGTSKKGMDCSGLVYTSFLEVDIPLPRTSRAMSLNGRRLYLEEIAKGDLLFFETNKNKKVINHVGLVVDVISNEIMFIHSSTSRGVIISSLSQSYWKDAFVMARRLL